MGNKLKKSKHILSERGVIPLIRGVRSYCTNKIRTYPHRFLTKKLLSDSINKVELKKSYANISIAYTEEYTASINYKHYTGNLPYDLKGYNGNYHINELIVSEINDVVVHNSGVVTTEEGRIIMDSIGNSDIHLYYEIKDTVCSITDIFKSLRKDNYTEIKPNPSDKVEFGFYMIRNGSYFHWVTEFLPTLRGLYRYERVTDNYPPIIVEKDPPDYVIDYLDTVGLKSRVKPLSSSVISMNELVLPQRRLRISNEYNPSPRDLAWLRNHFINNVSGGQDYPNRIYISRNDADVRRVSNEKKLVKRLNKRGFVDIELSNLSVQEQIKYFKNAKYIIGPHGAGLTNIVYNTNGTVIELFPINKVRPYFFRIAMQLGIEYDYFTYPQENKKADIRVDVENFIDGLDRIL
jgi:hypothetical protein